MGTGAGTHLIYGRLFRHPEIQADPKHAHCDYLELLAEYGVVGGVCMALFLAAHVRRGLRSFSEILRRRLIPSGVCRSNRFAIQLGVLCAIAGLAIHSVFDFDMHIPGNAMIFAILFGVLANPDIERAPGAVDRRFALVAKLLLPALGIVFLWRGLPLLPSEFCAEAARRSLRNHALTAAVEYAVKGIGPTAVAANGGASEEPPDLLDKLLSKAGPNPRNPDLYFYLGEANREIGLKLWNNYLRRDYYTRAVWAFDGGLQVFPQDEVMLVREGQVLDGLGRFDDAETVYRKALAWDPNLEAIYSYYETHLSAEGKKAEAEAMARKRQASARAEVEKEPKGDFQLQ